MRKKIKNIIRQTPLISGISKELYDKRNEKKSQKKIKDFLKNDLPFEKEAPQKYFIGHEPTIRCNLKCAMCYQKENRDQRREELSPEAVIKMYEKLKGKVNSIKVVGGEPLARRDVFEMLDFWDKEGVRIILQSNCTLINDHNIEKLAKIKNLSDITASLDGPQAIHDMVRGVPGTFDRLKKAIDLIRKHRPDVPVTLFGVILLEYNIDKLNEIIDTAKELGVKSMNFIFEQAYSSDVINHSKRIFEKRLNWKEGDYRINTQPRDPVFPENVDVNEIRNKLEKARKYGVSKGCYVNFLPYNFYENIPKYFGKKNTRIFCTKLLNPEFRVNQEGDVVWCDTIEKSFGNLTKSTPDEIWLSPEYQKFRKILHKGAFPICSRCCKAIYIDEK